MLGGSTRPRQPRPSAPVGAELGAADGGWGGSSKVFCTCFDQTDPRASGQPVRLPPSTAAFSTTSGRSLVNPETLCRRRRVLLCTKALFHPGERRLRLHCSFEPRAPLEKRDRISSCKQVLTVRRAYFWLRGGVGGGGKPHILLPTC